MTSLEPQRILVYRTGQIGDTIVALPAFWAIRRHFPEAHLTLLTGQHRQGNFLLASEVLPPSGLFDEIITYPTDLSGLSASQMPETLGDIRRRSFDAIAECIEAALDNPEEATRRVNAGRDMVRARYNKRLVFDQLEQAINLALQRAVGIQLARSK